MKEKQPYMSETRIVLLPHEVRVEVDLCPGTCGGGTWCAECRRDIRGEALRWLRELNVLPTQAPGEIPHWGRSWSGYLLLAD